MRRSVTTPGPRFADAVVVGTAAVRVVEAATAAGRDPVPALEAFVASLRAALAG